MLAEASRLAGMRLSGDRVQEARVRYAIGRLFAHLQQHGRASQEFDRVAVLTGDRPALPDLDALPLEHAAALRAAGRLDEAARLAETAVTSAQAQVPEDHDDLATTLLERARIALKQGDAVGARARALEARRALTLAPAERADLALAIDELLDEIARRPPPTR